MRAHSRRVARMLCSAAGTSVRGCAMSARITGSRASRTRESGGVMHGVTGDTLVAVRDLQVHFRVRPSLLTGGGGGWIRAVDGISLDLQRGETLGLVGESGSG